MNLIQTSITSAFSYLIKIVLLFVTNKIIAVYLGPPGIALIGQLQNFINISLTFANGGIGSGLTKYLSEFRDNEEKTKKFISTSTFITLFCSVFVAFFIIIFNKFLAVNLLKDEDFSYLFIIFSFSLIIFAINNLLLNILNGMKEIKKLITINTYANLISFLFSLFLITTYKLHGALISLVTSQSAVFIITLFFVLKSKWFKLKNFIPNYNNETASKLFGFSLMTFTSIFFINFSQIIIRNFIVYNQSVESAGYWQSIVKLSDIYLGFITMTLSIYYLPRLSEIKDKSILKKEIFSGYKIILPALFIMNISIYFLRFFIIKFVFTDKFMPISELFAFQMVGDFFKITSWLLAYLMFAKAMTKVFVITEILFIFGYLTLSIIFIQTFGIIGATFAYALNYFFYLLGMIWLFRDLIFKNFSKN